MKKGKGALNDSLGCQKGCLATHNFAEFTSKDHGGNWFIGADLENG